MSNPSIQSLQKLLKHIIYLRKKYTILISVFGLILLCYIQPEWQSLQILPKEYSFIMDDIIDYMENNLHEMHGFKDYEVLKMKRDKDWMLAGTTDIERKRGDFYRFFK